MASYDLVAVAECRAIKHNVIDSPIGSDPLFSIELGDLPIKQVGLTILQSSIFPVVAKSGNAIRSIGTCFAISNHGLCLTARHVIEEIELSDETDDNGNRTFVNEVGVIYINPDSKELGSAGGPLFGGFIPIRTVHLIDGTDVGLMHLNLPVHVGTDEFIPIPANRLSLALPSIADKVLALGYDQGIWSLKENCVNELHHNFKITQGEVTQIFPKMRDSAVMPFPCFECSATFLSGMSGGPVISHTGFVIGVITSSFEFDNDAQAVGYASLLAPAMHIKLLAKAEDGSEKPCFLWDFVDGGAVNVERADAIIRRTGDHLSILSGSVHFQSKLGS